MDKKLELILGVGVLGIFGSYATLAFIARNTLQADGQTYVHYSLKKGTAQNLLETYKIKVSSNDIVQPSLEQTLRWGERVKVTRVKEEQKEEEETLDFVLNWKRRTDKNLRMVELQDGVQETRTWEVQTRLHDGVEVDSKRTLKKVRKTPVRRLVFLNEREFPEKIYDLSKAKKVTVVATAYWEGDPQVPGVITYSGHRVIRGLVAVDPTTIPLGWRLYIPGYGYAYSSDTGSAIIGNRIDLFVENKEASRMWEYKKVDVYLLEKAKDW